MRLTTSAVDVYHSATCGWTCGLFVSRQVQDFKTIGNARAPPVPRAGAISWVTNGSPLMKAPVWGNFAVPKQRLHQVRTSVTMTRSMLAPAGKARPVGVRALLETRPSAAAASKVVLFARFKERHMKSRMRRRGYKSCTTPLRDPRRSQWDGDINWRRKPPTFLDGACTSVTARHCRHCWPQNAQNLARLADQKDYH